MELTCHHEGCMQVDLNSLGVSHTLHTGYVAISHPLPGPQSKIEPTHTHTSDLSLDHVIGHLNAPLWTTMAAWLRFADIGQPHFRISVHVQNTHRHMRTHRHEQEARQSHRTVTATSTHSLTHSHVSKNACNHPRTHAHAFITKDQEASQ
jgi:hypothetical protein